MRPFWPGLVATLWLLVGLWQSPRPVFADDPSSLQSPYRKGEILAKLRGGVAVQEVEVLFADPAVQVRGSVPPTGILRLSVPVGQELGRAAQLARSPHVQFAQPNWFYHIAAEPNDPLYPEQWALTRTTSTPLTNTINAPSAWELTTGDPGIVVAVLDSGIDPDHPDLAGAIWTNPNPTLSPPDIHGWNFISNTNDIRDDMEPAKGGPLPSHGTQVSGIIGARSNNGIGIAGLAGTVTIMPVKSVDQYGRLSSFATAQGITYAVDNGARVLNLSFTNPNPDDAVAEAVKYALAKGAVVVVAAGNLGDVGNPVMYPASLPGVLAVGNLARNGQRYPSSEYGAYIGVAAPGQLIVSTAYYSSTNTHSYGALTGTSVAAPHVSALAALILSLNPTLTNTDVIRIITSTASLAPGRNDELGYGVINVAAALRATPHKIRVQPASLEMYPTVRGMGTAAQLVNPGTAAGTWQINTATPWLSLGPTTGTTPSYAIVSIDPTKLPASPLATGLISVTSRLSSTVPSAQIVTVTARLVGRHVLFLPMSARGDTVGGW